MISHKSNTRKNINVSEIGRFSLQNFSMFYFIIIFIIITISSSISLSLLGVITI